MSFVSDELGPTNAPKWLQAFPLVEAYMAEEDFGNHSGFTKTLPEFEAEKKWYYNGVRAAVGQGPRLSMMTTEAAAAAAA